MKTQTYRFLFLEPFYGGSHRDFADGLVAHSRHEITLETLADRFWKWRLRGAAIYLARRISSPERYDGLIVSSLLGLADLKALWGRRCPPTLVYFHENQLTYPSAADERTDHQPGFTNITTALCGERLLFNSRAHRNAFLKALPRFVGIMPDYRPKWIFKAIAAKAKVVHPGCHPTSIPDFRLSVAHRKPLIIWNHRWEHDKNPADFFQALDAMTRRGIEYQVALLGENYERMPEEFKRAPERLGERLVQYGRVPGRRAYQGWLARGSVVVSTALQENFGIAVVEAMRHGCLPLLPERLSYPEILPPRFHGEFLYSDQQDLENKLARILTRQKDFAQRRRQVAAAMGRFDWPRAAKIFDEELTRLVETRRSSGSSPADADFIS